MIKEVLVQDVFLTHSYFYIDEKTKHGFLIDPGAEGKRLSQYIKNNGWVIEKVLLTHGHMDHIGGIKDLEKEIKMPVYAYENADQMLLSPEMNLSAYYRGREIRLEGTKKFRDGEIIALSSNPDFSLKVISAPGHTPDSVIFQSTFEPIAFTGDTIFKGAVGDPNYPGGDQEVLMQTLMTKVFTLPLETRFYSGHSESSTIKEEMERYHLR